MAKMNVGIASMQIQLLTQHHDKDEYWHGFNATTSVDATSWQI